MANVTNEIPIEHSHSCGIYSLTNKSNGKRLIGSTTDFKLRLNSYKCNFVHNRMHNPHIYNAIKKYGLDNFKFELINLCDKENLLEMETFYCKSFNTFDRLNGYNISIPNRPKEITLETRKKQSLARKGKKLSSEHRLALSVSRRNSNFKLVHNQESKDKISKANSGRTHFSTRVPIKQYDLNNNFIKEFDSLKSASLAVGCRSSAISAALSGRCETIAGYKWRYSNG